MEDLPLKIPNTISREAVDRLATDILRRKGVMWAEDERGPVQIAVDFGYICLEGAQADGTAQPEV